MPWYGYEHLRAIKPGDTVIIEPWQPGLGRDHLYDNAYPNRTMRGVVLHDIGIDRIRIEVEGCPFIIHDGRRVHPPDIIEKLAELNG